MCLNMRFQVEKPFSKLYQKIKLQLAYSLASLSNTRKHLIVTRDQTT